MPKIRIDKLIMYYEKHGAGDSLVLITGLGSNATIWFRQVPALSEHYQLLTFDNRGSGRTAKPQYEYRISEMAYDTRHLMDAVAMEPAHVFGFSMGGMIAQELAIRYPDSVKSLVLGCTFSGGQEMVGYRRPAGPGVESFEESMEASWRLLYSEEFIAGNKDMLMERARTLAELRPEPEFFERQVGAITRHDTFDRLPQIKVPTLIITGDADLLMPARNSTILHERIPNSELVTIAGAGHYFFIEKAEETNAHILRFLHSVEAGGSV
ncbi:MAG: alpha/beta hydrolase [Dehalococcoidia bacterium]